MNSEGISGIHIGQPKLDQYEGKSDDAALNSQGKFSNRKVRKFNNAVGSYLSSSPTHSHDLQLQQDRAQKTLNKRRITVLNDQGDASKAAKNVNKSPLTTNTGGKLVVAPCQDLEKSVTDFLALAKDPLAHGRVGEYGYNEEVTKEATKVTPQGPGTTKAIVNPEKFARRVQKDFTIFLGNTIKSTDTPHGLERLRQTVKQQFEAEQISKPQKAHLDKLIGKQYDLQLKNFPSYLTSLTAKADSDEARHEVAREKLAAIHEITIAAKEHDPGIVKKHHQMLKAAALDCYQDCGRSTPPKGADLYQAQEWVQRLEQEATDWLAPVLNLTSKHPNQRLKQAARSVAAQVDQLKLQLDEIPALERSMSTAATKAVKLMADMAKLESVIDQDQKQLGKKMLELKDMSESAGRFKRLNLVYQYRRKQNIQRQAVLRETIIADTSKKETSLDQFNSYRNSYNGDFKARNKLREKYGNSVEVLPKAPPPSNSALAWKAEISTLDGHNSITEFDKACINHHLDSLAPKFPSQDIEGAESLGIQYVNDVAKTYVSAVKDQSVLPIVALKSALGEGRISSVVQVQKAPNTSGYTDISQSTDEEQSIPALRPKNSSPVNKQPEPQTTEALEDTFSPKEETPQVASLNGSDFSALLKRTLEKSQNPDVTPENLKQIALQLEQMLANEELPEDGLEALADFFEYCASTPDGSEPPNYWKLDELMPGLQAGINVLKEEQTADEAVDEMERVLEERTSTTQTRATSETSETDSVLGSSTSIQVSEYIDSLFENFSPVATGSITGEDQDTLLGQLATAHENPDIQESDLNMVAFHLNNTLRQQPVSSQPIDFGLLSDALASALDQLNNKQSFLVANKMLDEKLAKSSLPDSAGQNKLRGNEEEPVDQIEV